MHKRAIAKIIGELCIRHGLQKAPRSFFMREAARCPDPEPLYSLRFRLLSSY
jgi:hypothetical protein